MNKKNIILGLSLILSSVATLNLTSCCDDDDDDTNHAPKSVQVDQNKAEQEKVDQQKAEQRKADSLKAEQKKADEAKVKEDTKKTDYTNPTPFDCDVKNYLADMFRGQISKITVGESDKCIIISFYANNSDVEAVNDKLNPGIKSNGAITTMIRETYPNAKLYGSGNVPTGKKSYFLITYDK